MTEESGPRPPDSSLGTVLRSKRAERDLTLAQASAATRVRAAHLAAIEADEIERLPAPVYARGYVRAYARYLDLDPEPLLALLPDAGVHAKGRLGLGPARDRPRFVFTTPAAIVAVVAVLAAAIALYAWRQIESVDPSAGPAGHEAPPLAVAAVPSATPLPSPSQRQPIVVGVRVTDTVWLNVIVDGQSQYSDSGRVFPPGAHVVFTGVDIKITSGKAASTFITVDGGAIGALGDGVVTREFKAP